MIVGRQKKFDVTLVDKANGNIPFISQPFMLLSLWENLAWIKIQPAWTRLAFK